MRTRNNSMLRPSIGHRTDAGLDVPFKKSFELEPGHSVCVELPIENLNLKRGTCGITFIRSKYAQYGVICQPTVIDAGYTGKVHVWLYNVTKACLTFEAGVAYIQIVCFKVREWKKVNGISVKVKSDAKRGKNRDTTR